MTVNPVSSSEVLIRDLATDAFRVAGLLHLTQTPNPDQLAAAYRFLDTIVRTTAVSGNQARFRGFDVITLTAGTREYALADSTLDVVGDGMYTPAGDTEGASSQETVVVRVDMEHRHLVTDKASQGRPFEFYTDRTARVPFVWLRPIPDETGAKIRFPVHRRVADSTDGATTLDVQQHWVEFYQLKLASRLCDASEKAAKALMLDAKAQRAYDYAITFSGHAEPGQARVAHRIRT